ncbi:MAG: Smr/MutS family protein [Dehalococcoidia bacterium]|nr:Smr/MutS family protein [Dehalococcoidia bacterium]
MPGKLSKYGIPERNAGVSPGIAEGEIRLRRLQTEEALEKLDTYLNQAFLSGLSSVRVIHGKGTGTLRDFVRKQLSIHPLVKSMRGGMPSEGGEGVTVITLESL